MHIPSFGPPSNPALIEGIMGVSAPTKADVAFRPTELSNP